MEKEFQRKGTTCSNDPKARVTPVLGGELKGPIWQAQGRHGEGAARWAGKAGVGGVPGMVGVIPAP